MYLQKVDKANSTALGQRLWLKNIGADPLLLATIVKEASCMVLHKYSSCLMIYTKSRVSRILFEKKKNPDVVCLKLFINLLRSSRFCSKKPSVCLNLILISLYSHKLWHYIGGKEDGLRILQTKKMLRNFYEASVRT